MPHRKNRIKGSIPFDAVFAYQKNGDKRRRSAEHLQAAHGKSARRAAVPIIGAPRG